MKNLIFFLSILLCPNILAQTELANIPTYATRNLSFSFVPTMGYSSVVPSSISSVISGTKLFGFQGQAAYFFRFDESIAMEVGLGFGSMQNGFTLNFDPDKYSFLQGVRHSTPIVHDYTFLYIPSKVFYYFPSSKKRKLFATIGMNFVPALSENARYSVIVNTKKGENIDFVTGEFKADETFLNYLSIGFGSEKALRRHNALRWSAEYQLGFKKLAGQATILQPDFTSQNENFFTQGNMLKLGFSYIFSNKKEFSVVPKVKDFSTQKGDIVLGIELGQNGTFKTIKDPKKIVTSKTTFGQVSEKASLEYFYSNNRSVAINARVFDTEECFKLTSSNGSVFCSGSSVQITYGLSHQWYKTLAKRLHWKSGIGVSYCFDDASSLRERETEFSDAIQAFKYQTKNTGSFALIDVEQSLEFNLSPAFRLYLTGQYSQGTRKAYLYDLKTINKDGVKDNFQGFSRGSNLGLSLGLKTNFGFLWR
jgi:hypothetical protein